METKSVIKKLGKLAKIDQYDNGKYSAVLNSKEATWWDQGGRAICLKVRRLNDIDDSQSDYSAGFFCDTIKEAINFLKS